MGEMAEAVLEGIVCKRCFALLIDDAGYASGKPTLCADCKATDADTDTLGTNYLPPRSS
jgi:hypothetical protein